MLHQKSFQKFQRDTAVQPEENIINTSGKSGTGSKLN